MIKASEAFEKAIVADARRIRVRASIAIVDPDIVYGAASSSGAASFAKTDELHDKDTDIKSKYQSLEMNRFVLDGTFSTMPSEGWNGETAYCSSELCDADGLFENEQFVELRFSGVDVLQSASVFFANDVHDGIPKDFRIDVMQGSTSYFTQTVTDNDLSELSFKDFTVYNPTSIRVTITRWSLPYRRARVAEIVPGTYEEWSCDQIADLNISQKCDVSNLSLPFGTCDIKIDNLDRRFEPRRKGGLFESLEDRQGIDISLGVDLPDGTIEWIPCGTYFQSDSGWKTSENNITIDWKLVDIIGLLVDRRFIPPDPLPVTLSGWIACIVQHLGVNFANKYRVDPNYADMSCQVRRADIFEPDPNTGSIANKTCGEILSFVCMACGVFPRADSRDGYLAVEPLWSEGNKYDLDNITKYPTISANDDIASIDINGYKFDGNEVASRNSVSIDNPFLTNQQKIVNAVRAALSTRGGNIMSTTGRGNPTSECGDVGTVWLDESNATTGRVVEQSFSMSRGVLAGCSTKFLQSDGSYMWSNRAKMTESGTFEVPDGVSRLRMILVGHGQDGEDGHHGYVWAFIQFKPDKTGQEIRPAMLAKIEGAYWSKDFYNSIESIDLKETHEAKDGKDGAGGKVWSGTVNVNPHEVIEVHIGTSYEDPTTASVYSSANGHVYENGYADINALESFARSGVGEPIDGSGDGGKGGVGGTQSGVWTVSFFDDPNLPDWDLAGHVEVGYDTGVVGKGSKGAKGCAIFYWEVNES